VNLLGDNIGSVETKKGGKVDSEQKRN